MYQFLTWLVGVGGGSAVLVLVAKAVIPHLFSRDLERFKAELSREVSIEIEKVKHELMRASIEHETSFKWLYAKRSEATAELYQRFIVAAAAIDDASNTAVLVSDLDLGVDLAAIPAEEARTAFVVFVQALRGARHAIDEEVDRIFSRAEAELDDLLFNVLLFDSVRRANPGNQRREELDAVTEIRKRRTTLPEVERAVVTALRAALPRVDNSGPGGKSER
jgi:hypothetical protein